MAQDSRGQIDSQTAVYAFFAIMASAFVVTVTLDFMIALMSGAL
ncbi:hypothetical protein ACFPYI_01775 [Halomarina salina]|uniref:Uncharacterized protein n=1 Tax=Halomarina salina TaxID=1872699 RepID=A0ABD5RIB2_9EURY|nr:hypothetical protein [Halomarina salina]